MNNTYANLFDRAKAAFIDTIIILAAFYAISEILNLFDEVPNYLRVILFSVVLFYEPIFISLYGSTMGHGFMKLMVSRDQETPRKLSFFQATLRFVIKVLLGWISFLIAMGNNKKQTIHDMVVRSIVIND